MAHEHEEIDELLARAEQELARSGSQPDAREAHIRAAQALLARARRLISPTAPLPAAEPSPGALRFVFVMDNEILRKVIGSIITKRGHHLVALPTMVDLLATLDTERPDVVLLDLSEAEELQVAQLTAVRQRESEDAHDHIPIIGLTSTEPFLQDGFAQWVGLLDAYFPAPIGTERFFQTVDRVLARSALWS